MEPLAIACSLSVEGSHHLLKSRSDDGGASKLAQSLTSHGRALPARSSPSAPPPRRDDDVMADPGSWRPRWQWQLSSRRARTSVPVSASEVPARICREHVPASALCPPRPLAMAQSRREGVRGVSHSHTPLPEAASERAPPHSHVPDQAPRGLVWVCVCVAAASAGWQASAPAALGAWHTADPRRAGLTLSREVQNGRGSGRVGRS